MFKIAIISLGIALFPLYGQAADVFKTAEDTVKSFEKKFGVTKGKRRNHTKGFCFEAEFIPVDKAIRKYTISPIFAGKSTVTGRLSHKGGNNAAADNKPAAYGMGLEISTSSDDVHNITMNTLDFFPVATPEAFAELMRAKAAGGDAVKVFKAKNKDLQHFKAHMAKKPKASLTPYEGTTFNSVNSFYLVDGKDKKTAIRWSFVPVQEQKIVLDSKQDFFLENMQANLDKHGIAWDMVVTIANPDDVVDNAALPWEGEHTQITAAKLKVKSISSEKDGKCDDINYDPLVLSDGFEPSNDPLLEARSASYAISFSKRLAEKKDKADNQ